MAQLHKTLCVLLASAHLRCLGRSRLTGLRTFFLQALLAPKKAPSPSTRSRWTLYENSGWTSAQMQARIGRLSPADEGIDLSIEPVCFSNTNERKTNPVRVLWGLAKILHAKKRHKKTPFTGRHSQLFDG